MGWRLIKCALFARQKIIFIDKIPGLVHGGAEEPGHFFFACKINYKPLS